MIGARPDEGLGRCGKQSTQGKIRGSRRFSGFSDMVSKVGAGHMPGKHRGSIPRGKRDEDLLEVGTGMAPSARSTGPGRAHSKGGMPSWRSLYTTALPNPPPLPPPRPRRGGGRGEREGVVVAGRCRGFANVTIHAARAWHFRKLTFQDQGDVVDSREVRTTTCTRFKKAAPF